MGGGLVVRFVGVEDAGCGADVHQGKQVSSMLLLCMTSTLMLSAVCVAVTMGWVARGFVPYYAL